MSVYFITVSLIAILCLLAQRTNCSRMKLDSDGRYQHTKQTTLFYALAAGVLIFVSGMRYGVGTDFFGYFYNYENYAKELYECIKTLNEPGFRFICWIVVRLGGNGANVIFCSSVITMGLFLYTIYRNTDRFFLATLLFVFLGCWHGSFNGIRQYLAAAIIFCGVGYIKQHDFKKYCFVVFCAFLFHGSAILMIFAYFVAHNKINFRNIVLMVIGSLIILSSFDRVMEWTSFLLNAEYSETNEYLTNSVNFLRVLVAIVPSVFFLIMSWRKKWDEEQRCWMNFLILNSIMMLATSNSTYLARMGMYTTPFLALGIPELIKGLNYRNRKIISLVIPVAYAFYWWYEISNSSALNNFRFIWQR